MLVYETVEAAAADVGVDTWLCHYPIEVWGDTPPPQSWDAPLTDEQFANVVDVANKEGW